MGLNASDRALRLSSSQLFDQRQTDVLILIHSVSGWQCLQCALLRLRAEIIEGHFRSPFELFLAFMQEESLPRLLLMTENAISKW